MSYGIIGGQTGAELSSNSPIFVSGVISFELNLGVTEEFYVPLSLPVNYTELIGKKCSVYINILGDCATSGSSLLTGTINYIIPSTQNSSNPSTHKISLTGQLNNESTCLIMDCRTTLELGDSQLAIQIHNLSNEDLYDTSKIMVTCVFQ